LADRYLIERELGRGGMATVYLAHDVRHGRRVALKALHPELAATLGLERFLREIRLTARLQHPHILTVLDSGEAAGCLWFTMPYVEGESLRQRLARERQLPIDQALRITLDVAQALEYAHQQGVIHRDIKPENLLLTTDRSAVVADFGLAHCLDAAAEDLTGAGIAVGTVTYMSPEQGSGAKGLDPRTDIYSLGCVLYEMLVGDPPFSGRSPAAILARKSLEAVPRLRVVREAIPQALEDVIMQALAKVPADRFATMQAFAEAVRDACAESVRGNRPAAIRPRREKAYMVSLLATVALILAAVIVSTLVRRQPMPPRGIDPRRSVLVLPFRNLRQDPTLDWLREGTVSMLALNLSQWNDLTVIDPEQVHDLLSRRGLRADDEIGLERARGLARDAGVWTIVLGDFASGEDSLHLIARVYDAASGERLDIATADGPAAGDVRPLFDELGSKLLKLSGALSEPVSLASATTHSLEAFRAYLTGIERLNQWDLNGAEACFLRATAIDTGFGLAYYKLALTRGWLVGADDSIADRALARAVAHSARLPPRERKVIKAYRAFIDGEYSAARALYQELVARDSIDVDAWYWMGETWFHETLDTDAGPHWTAAMRAFRHALSVDPAHALAYDHVQTMLNAAANPRPLLALATRDSFVQARLPDGTQVLPAPVMDSAVRLARAEAVKAGQSWVASQPTTFRAHQALVNAYVAAGDYARALNEVGRFREATPAHPEALFIEARIHFAAGDVDRAAAKLRMAFETVTPSDFRIYVGVPPVIFDVVAAPNVFAYQGDLTNAVRAIDFAEGVRREVSRIPVSRTQIPGGQSWKQGLLSELYGGAGTPIATLQQVWRDIAVAARAAPPDVRRQVAFAGASAAIGLLVSPAEDTSALAELHALTGWPLPRELRALLALKRQDRTAARAALAEPETAPITIINASYKRLLAAQAYFLLGDYEAVVRSLGDFVPTVFRTNSFDGRWAVLGRVRLLRGAALERLGRPSEALEQYRAALSQWRAADKAFELFVRQGQAGLTRVAEQR
jgi:serine/threonine-protein kinase